ncbi:inositol monophosphatase [Alicyclobacillus tolerans]|uniref:inositol monophosphatase family protein n=1 Tax=Alicyclobacillus tolerans TaxID=90970 RepID=UPI001F2CD64F|nr:inositol monophosphatase family protein [Alicyclobacillus tolerans]MCF8566051.1 inositol monophosphatase [Alicyclobacillus tolerans]
MSHEVHQKLEDQKLRQVLAVAIQAALEAGDYFRSRLDTELHVKTKSSPSDLVTDVDPECERRIRAQISAAFPTHSILGEETTAPGSEASLQAAQKVQGQDHLWIVDPLDGTTNFVYGIPVSVVSIGYAQNGKLKAGVVYDPYRAEVFLGMDSHGAYLASSADADAFAQNPLGALPGRELSVTKRTRLEESVVATGFPTRSSERERTTEAGIRLSGQVKNLRAMGSAALHLAYVAAGRLDAFWEYDLNAWDLAAGVLLIQAAGGFAGDMNGAEYHLATRDIVASGDIELSRKIREAIG